MSILFASLLIIFTVKQLLSLPAIHYLGILALTAILGQVLWFGNELPTIPLFVSLFLYAITVFQTGRSYYYSWVRSGKNYLLMTLHIGMLLWAVLLFFVQPDEISHIQIVSGGSGGAVTSNVRSLEGAIFAIIVRAISTFIIAIASHALSEPENQPAAAYLTLYVGCILVGAIFTMFFSSKIKHW